MLDIVYLVLYLPFGWFISSFSTSSCKFFAVMASTFDLFLRRLPSELGWAPGKLITPPEWGVEELSSGCRDGALVEPVVFDSVDGLGVP